MRAHLLLCAVALVTMTGCRGCRRRADDGPGHPPAPVGGVASAGETDAGDGGDEILEDMRSFPVLQWSFDLDRYELTIKDVGMTTALDAVLDRTGADVVVNGGFFDRDGKALGLALSADVQLAPLARPLSGGVVTIDRDRARLFAAEGFVLPEGAHFAIQCRPRLVVDGVANVRSDDGKRSERTALCLRDEGRTLDLIVVRGKNAAEDSGPSLFALGRFLAERGCEDALNLDGGPSTGVAWREGDRARVLAPRGPIRHAVVFKKR